MSTWPSTISEFGPVADCDEGAVDVDRAVLAVTRVMEHDALQRPVVARLEAVDGEGREQLDVVRRAGAVEHDR